MQVTLVEDEIKEAVEKYVRAQINILENQEIAIDFTAGRGDRGLTASLDIRRKDAPKVSSAPIHIEQEVVEEAPPAKAPKVASVKFTPAVETTPVVEEAEEVVEEKAEAETQEPELPKTNPFKRSSAPAVQEATEVSEKPSRSIFSKA